MAAHDLSAEQLLRLVRAGFASKRQPAHLFMCLDADNPKQAGREIVQMIVERLKRAIEIYNERAADGGAPLMSDSIVREHFLRPQMRHREKTRRTLITTFISFLAEWDYRSQMIELGSRVEGAFLHSPFQRLLIV
jgi:hypothetical protein